jgi:hypothetical protein
MAHMHIQFVSDNRYIVLSIILTLTCIFKAKHGNKIPLLCVVYTKETNGRSNGRLVISG